MIEKADLSKVRLAFSSYSIIEVPDLIERSEKKNLGQGKVIYFSTKSSMGNFKSS